eukprot:TRINITY_DN110783_c0_g1_i1.p1 TRINITY_DN110783_c0_g1~~TRINITY_DN110783_c0_g1_i1.p1  ORF type:complete len:190 (-),score=14.68 TRINITY_DN110783_c0_g1_i1:17-586(-)
MGASTPPFRHRKSASERRTQKERSDVRKMLHLLRGLASVQDHRGGQLPKIGQPLFKALSVELVSAPLGDKVDASVQHGPCLLDCAVQATRHVTEVATQTFTNSSGMPVSLTGEWIPLPGKVLVAARSFEAADMVPFTIEEGSFGLVEGADIEHDIVMHFTEKTGSRYQVRRLTVFREDLACFLQINENG